LANKDQTPQILELAGGILDMLSGAVKDRVQNPTKTVVMNIAATGVVSWKSDNDYVIVMVSGATSTATGILNFGGQTYAALNVVGVHFDWLVFFGTNANIPVKIPLAKDQIIYSSFSGAGGVMLIMERA